MGIVIEYMTIINLTIIPPIHILTTSGRRLVASTLSRHTAASHRLQQHVVAMNRCQSGIAGANAVLVYRRIAEAILCLFPCQRGIEHVLRLSSWL